MNRRRTSINQPSGTGQLDSKWAAAWRPDLTGGTGPLYRGIAAALARDVREGRLAPGDRLPTHRALARALGVTVGTVSQGYAEAERRGLVVGKVGSGTYVRGSVPAPNGGPADLVDLSYNFPPAGDEEDAIRAALIALAETPGLAALFNYQPGAGVPDHRAAGAEWLRRVGLPAVPERTLVTGGAQHAIAVLCATLLQPGELVATEDLTYPGMKGLAQMLGLRLRGLPIDDGGIVPHGFARACAEEPVRALYTIPSIQNPTGSVLSEKRRREIAGIAERHGVMVFEDDVHARLLESPPPPIARFHPAGSFYVASLAKALSPGLRVGFLYAPAETVDRLAAGIRTTLWNAPPIMAEIAARWIEDGTAEALVVAKRAEAAARARLAVERLGVHGLRVHPTGFHAWLPLPPPWRTADFVAMAEQRGVRIAGAEAFAVGRGEAPHAVRLCLGAAASRAALERALDGLAELLAAGAEPYLRLV